MRKAFLILLFFASFSFPISESSIDKRGDLKIKSSLLKKSENIFSLIKYSDNFSILNALRKLNDLNIINSSRQSLLHLAVLYKRYEIARYLVKNGAKVYLQDANGDTPLHIAVRNLDIAFIKILLLSPSSMSALFIKNSDSMTPLDMALKKGDKRVIGIFENFMQKDDVDDIFGRKKESSKKRFFKNSLYFKGSKNFGNINVKIGEGRVR